MMSPEQVASATLDGDAGHEPVATDPLAAAGAPPVDGDEVVLAPRERLFRGPRGWLDAVIILPLAFKSVYAYAGQAFGLYLTLNSHPIRAAFLRGSLSAMILSGAGVRLGSVALWLAILAPLPYTMLTDPCCYWAGRRYGRRLIDYMVQSNPRMIRKVARGERLFARFASWAVFFAPVIWLPNEIFYFLAGETRMPFRRFILLDLFGQLVFIAEVVAIGYFIGKPAVNFVTAIAPYSIWISIGVFVVAFLFALPGAVRSANEKVAAREHPPDR